MLELKSAPAMSGKTHILTPLKLLGRRKFTKIPQMKFKNHKKRFYPRRSVFLLAAEKQFMAKGGHTSSVSYSSCVNLFYASRELRSGYHEESGLYLRYFKPEGLNHFEFWWPKDEDGNWDHESRILALLFTAEMLCR